jgi:uncharacterized protein (DUF1501 family)
MFFAEQTGYDTHIGQINIQAGLLRDLDQAIGSFWQAMNELGLANQVLLFTISDFGRTYQSNTSAGADHGWGNHQLVIGGGITGGRILGQMPSGEFGGSDDLTGQGVWVPSTSTVQMAGGVANWIGITPAQSASIFPDLQKFSTGALSF